MCTIRFVLINNFNLSNLVKPFSSDSLAPIRFILLDVLNFSIYIVPNFHVLPNFYHSMHPKDYRPLLHYCINVVIFVIIYT